MHSNFFDLDGEYRENLAQLFNTEPLYLTPSTHNYQLDFIICRLLPWQEMVGGNNNTLWALERHEFGAMTYRANAHHASWLAAQAAVRARLRQRLCNAMFNDPRYAEGRLVRARTSLRAEFLRAGKSLGALFAKHKGAPDAFVSEVLLLIKQGHGRHSYWAQCAYTMIEKKFGMATRCNIDLLLDSSINGSWCLPNTRWHDVIYSGKNALAGLHHPHVAESDPNLLAYTQSVDKLGRWIQTTTKPGRYLTKFYPHLSTDEVRELAERWNINSSNKLLFIENGDAEGWKRVYRNGPYSCMRDCSAVEVYAHPGNGLRLAYWQNIDEKIVARAIVREDDRENPCFIRVYPNTDNTEDSKTHHAFRAVLESAGYSHGNLDDIQLARIEEDDGRFIMPYLDRGNGGSQCVDDQGTHFIVIRGGEYECTNTGGYINCREHRYCSFCDCECYEEDMTWIENEEDMVCQDCLDNDYVYAYGTRYRGWFNREDCIYCESDNDYYAEDSASNHNVYECMRSNLWYHIDDLMSIDAGIHSGDMIHYDEAIEDEVSGNYIWVGDSITTEDGLRVLEEDTAQCELDGNVYHINYLTSLRVGWNGHHAKTLYFYPPNLTAEVLVNEFVRCGDMLLPNTYYGNELTVDDCDFSASNINYAVEGKCEYIGETLKAHFEDQSIDEDDFPPVSQSIITAINFAHAA